MATAKEKMAEGYNAQAKKDPKELLDAIGSVGKGAVTFGEIDKYLEANPDSQYFRIDNGGSTVKSPRSYSNDFGTWTDNDAAIVGQDSDKGSRDIFRYANISAADPRTGKRGEKATVGLQYAPSSFFKDNGIDYNSSYGMVYSRDEYGKLKQSAADLGKSDQFLSAGAEKKPTFASDYGKKEAILTGDSNVRRANLSSDSTDSLSNEEDAAAKASRKLLG